MPYFLALKRKTSLRVYCTSTSSFIVAQLAFDTNVEGEKASRFAGSVDPTFLEMMMFVILHCGMTLTSSVFISPRVREFWAYVAANIRTVLV